MVGMGDIAENLGLHLSGQKTRICHLERLDPKALGLGRSGTVEGDAAGVDMGKLSEVIPCSEPCGFYHYPLSPFYSHIHCPLPGRS